MEIRRLGQNDGSLLEAAIQRLLVPPKGSHEATSRCHLAEALADPSCYFFVCHRDAVPIGYLSAYRFPAVKHDGFLVYLYDLVVDPKQRRRGIGAQLIGGLKDTCRADGVTRIWVGTALENYAARRTFEGTGARMVSETFIEYVYDLTQDGQAPKGASCCMPS